MSNKHSCKDTKRSIRLGRRNLGIVNKTLCKKIPNLIDIHMAWQKNLKYIFKHNLKRKIGNSAPPVPLKRPLTLIISNFPATWNHACIKNYIEVECGNVERIDLLVPQGDQASVLVKFFTHIQLIIAKAQLTNREINGIRLIITDEHDRDNQNTMQPTYNRFKPYLDVWEDDPQGLYGLKPEFLKALDITPPIDKWVHVHNFRCEKPELKEVMEIAGEVLVCSIEQGIFKFAKIKYSHPLEAVQAVSMLNGQIFNGQCLSVTMERYSNDASSRPQGLIAVGPGLGKNGKAVRNIAQHYDRFVKKQSTLINSLLFVDFGDTTDGNGVSKGETNVKPVQGLVGPQGINVSDLKNEPMQLDGSISCNVEQVLSENNQVSSQNLVLNPVNFYHAPIRNVQVRTTKPEAHAQSLPGHNLAAPSAINPMQPLANSTFGSIIPQPGNASQKLQNVDMYWNPLPQPIVMTQNSFMYPNMDPNRPNPCNDMRRNNLVQLVPRFPLVPAQIRPQGPVPENGKVLNFSNAHNHEAELLGPHSISLGPTLFAGSIITPVKSAFNCNGDAQTVPNPAMYLRPGTSNTVVLNNLPTCSFEVLLDKLSKCGQVMLVKSQHPKNAVVTFATAEQAEKCIQMYNGFAAGDCILDVSYA